ncbi:MAG: hypothetical protein B7Y76_08400, partial [Sphingobacteriia bacterium 35-40-5]
HEVVTEKEDWFDSRVFAILSNYSTNFSIQLFRGFTFFGSGTFLFPAYTIILAWLFYKHRKTDAIDIALLAITSSLLLHVLKISFARHRPELPLLTDSNTYSFPSGHTLSSFVFLSILVWRLWQSDIDTKWKWTFTIISVLLSLAIGVSRIVLRYHYASDVVAGFSLGVAYVLLFFWLRNIWRRNKL